MKLPTLGLTATLAVALATSPALADRIVTPPVPLNGSLRCEVAYFGGSSNVPIQIIFAHPIGYVQATTVKMGPNRRVAGVWYQASCSSAPCPAMACAFSGPVPASDLSGTAYVTDKAGAIRTIVPAR